MRVVGIDPGLTRCGVAVIDVASNRRVGLVGATVIRSSPQDELGTRLWALEQEIESFLDRYMAESIGIERVFSQANVRTVAGTAQAAGVAALIGARRRIPVQFHTPTEVKAAVTGSGRADKVQVAQMVNRIARSQAGGPADLTDAIAIAICHGWNVQFQSRAAGYRTSDSMGAH